MEPSEQETIRRVLAGDREEYCVLMERHLPAVLRMSLRVTGSMEDAEEASQEAFLLAYNKLGSFRRQASFGTWVYRIAMNCSLNLIKRRARTLEWNAEPLDDSPGSQASAVSHYPTPEASLLDGEANQRRQRAMQTLTPMEHAAFVLRHLEEQPVEVIANALGINRNAARQAIFRAALKLRRELAPANTRLKHGLTSSPVLKEVQ